MEVINVLAWAGFHNNSQELISHSLEVGASKIKMLANVVSGENSSGGCLLSVCSHGFSLLHSHRVSGGWGMWRYQGGGMHSGVSSYKNNNPFMSSSNPNP